MRLTDSELAELRLLAAGGVKQVEIAERFKVSQSAVSRLLRQDRRADSGSVEGEVFAAVQMFLAELPLEGPALVRAAVARSLALKLDGCIASPAVASAMPAARLAEALEAAIGALDAERTQEVAQLALKRLLAPLS